MFIKMFFKQLKFIDYLYYFVSLLATALFVANAVIRYQAGNQSSGNLMLICVALQVIAILLHLVGDIASTKNLINREQATKELKNQGE